MLQNSISSSTNLVEYTEYGVPIRNLWHMLLYAWNEVPWKNHRLLEGVEDAPSLDALLASVLASLIQQRLRIGLGRSYVYEKHAIRGVRGRIDFTLSMKQHAFEKGQAYCEFHQFSANAPKNQIVRSMLTRLVQTGNFGPAQTLADELRHRLRMLTRALDGIDIIELKVDFIRRQQFGRNDGDYRLMLAICEFLLQRQMPLEHEGTQSIPTIDREALVFSNIYERFVANFYRIHLKGWTVRAQIPLSWHAQQEHSLLPSMRPDLILEDRHSERSIVLDTKFTARSLTEGKYGKLTFASSHLYQIYTYLKTQEHLSEMHRNASGILLYPTAYFNLSEKIQLNDHLILVECLDLTAPWHQIEKQLLSLVMGK